MVDAPLRWPLVGRPFSTARQNAVRTFVLVAALVFLGIEVVGDFYLAARFNHVQQVTDAEFVRHPATSVWLQVTYWPRSDGVTPAGGGGLDILVTGLPDHCGKGREPWLDSGLSVRDWCSKVLIDPNAASKALGPCKNPPSGSYACREGRINAMIQGNRISFGPYTGTYYWPVLVFRNLVSKVLLLVIVPCALVAAILPLGFLDFLYGRVGQSA